MTIALYILGALAAAIAIIIAIAATKPADFITTRSALLRAPADAIFPHVNDFHKWPDWNPFEKLDPNAKLTYTGPPSGLGSSYAWDGNKQAGAGSATITESRPNQLVRMDLKFTRPFVANNEALFKFQPQAGGTAVTWEMSGARPLMFRIFGLFVDCDKMVGNSFEEGLANLARVVENSPQPAHA